MTKDSISNKLSELFELYKSGAVTKEEYDILKSEIIGHKQIVEGSPKNQKIKQKEKPDLTKEKEIEEKKGNKIWIYSIFAAICIIILIVLIMRDKTEQVSITRSNLTSSIKLTKWNYIAVTKSADLAGKLYINGVLVSTGLWEDQSYNYVNLYIGASYYTSWGGFYKGYLDEFRMSDRVRTAAEIAEYFSLNQEFEIDNNTIGLWHFNEEDGETFSNDAYGSTSSGDLFNGVKFVSGKFGNALNFDGISNRGNCNIDIPESDITFEFWFKFDEPQDGIILSAYGAYNSHIKFNLK